MHVNCIMVLLELDNLFSKKKTKKDHFIHTCILILKFMLKIWDL